MDRQRELETRLKEWRRKLKAREGRSEYRETIPMLKKLIDEAEAELSKLKGTPDAS